MFARPQEPWLAHPSTRCPQPVEGGSVSHQPPRPQHYRVLVIIIELILCTHTRMCKGPPGQTAPSGTDVSARPQEPWLADPRSDPALPTRSAPHPAAEPGAVSTGCRECTSPSTSNAVHSCVHTHTSKKWKHHSSCCAPPLPSLPLLR